ncbi:MAG: type VI secretion system lipoprotein TssJ [endosymbiont of Galathealinum brachiosum]|uniref:Type VI secretion system lipoprotein TssJ n=1 Tax=endosymbiont of Galathealinum brachiosum TaxID=2200906 RepID=A0A370DFY8_9GAMM|nr:MAG: type VI secretion system lipoprotein TssJ [endosymbiont of Galathealinum brachiosum]
MKNFRLLKLILITSFFAVLTACQSMNGAVGGYFGLDTDLEITFEVDADTNPDELGKPSPVFIRMYELKSKKMMKKSDFIELYERDKEVLGADMLAVHKLKHFKPGDNRSEHFVLSPKTHYVALYAEFLEYKHSKYKLIIPVVANNVFRNSVSIRVSGNELIFNEEIDEEIDDGSDFKEKVDKTKESADEAQDTADKTKKSADKLKKLF